MPEAPRPAVWPTTADRLLAKPRAKTPSDPPAESLPTHTWRVLSRLAELARLQPDLPARVGDERLWHRLFWACFLHDFGKAASGFQAFMTTRKRWGYRHEALSLAFVAWLAFTEDDRLAIIAAIASHHKDHDEFWRQHKPPARDVDPEDDEDSDVSQLCRDLRSEHRDALWDWLDRCRGAWVAALGLPGVETPELCPKDVAAKRLRPTAIYRAARRYHDWVEALDERDARSERRRSIILRGLIMLADHTGSADPETPAFTPLSLNPARIMAGKTPNEHQQRLATVDGHAILVAPTGSGKTEAALLWAARQQAQTGAPRLFYTLPYQASLNAMGARLERALGPDTVSLQHGRALLAIYRRLLTADLDDSPGAVEAAARARRNYGRLAVTPARALSPYQLLKALFRLDGYEKMMTDATGGVFVLDEVHAYEPARLALFVTLLQALVADYGARVLVMSATLPTLARQAFHEALGDATIVRASDATYASARRHRIQCESGDLLSAEALDQIAVSNRQGEAGLVCLNTVDRAVHAYRELRVRLPDGDVTLLHSRFTGRDRWRKEQHVMEVAALGRRGRSTDGARAAAPVVVATQVVEVSLNLDLDRLYTDPAPLDALVQRFGRVNRRNEMPGGALVHVFDELGPGKYVYDDAVVDATMAVLRAHNGDWVDEQRVEAWLDEIYTGAIAEQWRATYDRARNDAAPLVGQLRAFASADSTLTRRFYQLFDGVDMLPKALTDEYNRLEMEGRLIEAQELMVSVGWPLFKRLADRFGAVVGDERKRWFVVNAPYSEEYGLQVREDSPDDNDTDEEDDGWPS